MSVKVGVVIGRFRGFHKYHMDHIVRAANENDIVMILIGSSNRRVSIKNPFTADETMRMIEENVRVEAVPNGRIPPNVYIAYRFLPDNPLDNEAWADNAVHMVEPYVSSPEDVTIYGCDKDSSTFYFKLFPQWKQSLTESDGSNFDATQLREAWFKGEQSSAHLFRMKNEGFISTETFWFLNRVRYKESLQEEWEFYQKEKERFADYPFPDTLSFSCGDAVVKWQDEILFIVRGKAPGKDCLALPGGFKNRNETFFDAAIRELYEETRMNISPAALMQCVQNDELFDDPSRSIGIPRATLAVLFDVTEMFEERPEIYPADDAVGFEWIKTNRLDDVATRIYDDHMFIVKKLLSI
jgi:bifunctional NMN adenylyltransferase/nudix hydrolase